MAGNSNSGRKPGFKHSPLTKEKIKAKQILNRLEKFILSDQSDYEGKSEEEKKKSSEAFMTSSQVKAAMNLLNKVVGNKAPVPHDVEDDGDTEVIFNTVVEQKPDHLVN